MRYNNTKPALALFIGILGACITLYGYLFQAPFPQPFYIIGSIALLVTAIYCKLIYFIALELILVSGHLAILLGSGPYTQAMLPLLLSLQLFIFFLMINKENIYFWSVGVAGISLLSIGLAFKNEWYFFFGSLFVAVYSAYMIYKGNKIAYLWALLNTLFTFLALYQLTIPFLGFNYE